jgi:hypothetical protein
MPTVTQDYFVRLHEIVTLDATIGDGQGGGHSVFLGENLIAQGAMELRDVAVGMGSDIVNKVLVVSSTAVDVQTAHDRVSVEVVLRGGIPGVLPIAQTTDVDPGGNETFLTVITFVSGGGA